MRSYAIVAVFGLLGIYSDAQESRTVFDLAKDSGIPATESLLERLRKTDDTVGMREHAWHLWREINRAVPNSSYPLWFSWCTRDEVFDPKVNCSADGSASSHAFALAGVRSKFPSLPAASKARDAKSESYFSPEAAAFLRKQFQLLKVNPAEGIPFDKFPRGSVIVKAAWWAIRPGERQTLPQYSGTPEQIRAIENGTGIEAFKPLAAVFSDKIENQRCDASSFNPPPENAGSPVSLKDFFYRQICGMEANGIDMNGYPVQSGDIALLLGLHVITREIKDWTWATFWWHPEPEQGPFAANRPPDLNPNHWTGRYLMDVTFDEDTPRQPDGRSRAIFNPYLEGVIEKGNRSNCMSCHRLAGYRSTAQGTFTPTPILPVSVRGLQPDHPLLKDYCSTQFMWSLAASVVAKAPSLKASVTRGGPSGSILVPLPAYPADPILHVDGNLPVGVTFQQEIKQSFCLTVGMIHFTATASAPVGETTLHLRVVNGPVTQNVEFTLHIL